MTSTCEQLRRDGGAALAEHAQTCQGCRDWLAATATVDRWLAQSDTPAPRLDWDDLAQRLDAVDERRRLRRRLWLWLPLPTAAAAAVAVVAVRLAEREQGPVVADVGLAADWEMVDQLDIVDALDALEVLAESGDAR